MRLRQSQTPQLPAQPPPLAQPGIARPPAPALDLSEVGPPAAGVPWVAWSEAGAEIQGA